MTKNILWFLFFLLLFLLGRPTTSNHGFLSISSAKASQGSLPFWAMTAPLPNTSIPGSASALLLTSDYLLNLTAASQVGHGSAQSLPPLCTLCCCGVLNRILAVAFMVTLAFAVVIGNVVTLTVFVQTRQSRTPQGYLKGNFIMKIFSFLKI